MAIHFISGKPRAGKSLLGMRLLLNELINGRRTIVTNLPLNLGRVNEYLQEKEGASAPAILDRIILLDDSTETGKFWTVRPERPEIRVLSKLEWEQGKKPDYSGVDDDGVLYIIDEVHNFFNARAWMETGRDVLFYLSQHAKLGDDVICITQAVGNVDKQFRSVTQDYTYVRNLSKEKYGKFKLPALFIAKVFGAPPTETSQPMETYTFKLDVSGIASCYDTARGVGISGKAADKGKSARGISWVWLVVGIPLIAFGFFKFAPPVLAKLFVKPLEKYNTVAPPVTTQTNTPSVVLPRSNNLPAPEPDVLQFPKNQQTGFSTNVITVVSADSLTGRWRVVLSTGEVYWGGQGELTELGQNHAIINGVRYPFGHPKQGQFQFGIVRDPPTIENPEPAPATVEVTIIGKRPEPVSPTWVTQRQNTLQ